MKYFTVTGDVEQDRVTHMYSTYPVLKKDF